MKKSEKGAASVRLEAPKKLARWAEDSGFRASIVLTRTGVTPPGAKDPGADPGPIGDPIKGKELELLRGLLAAYDASKSSRSK